MFGEKVDLFIERNKKDIIEEDTIGGIEKKLKRLENKLKEESLALEWKDVHGEKRWLIVIKYRRIL